MKATTKCINLKWSLPWLWVAIIGICKWNIKHFVIKWYSKTEIFLWRLLSCWSEIHMFTIHVIVNQEISRNNFTIFIIPPEQLSISVMFANNISAETTHLTLYYSRHFLRSFRKTWSSATEVFHFSVQIRSPIQRQV